MQFRENVYKPVIKIYIKYLFITGPEGYGKIVNQ